MAVVQNTLQTMAQKVLVSGTAENTQGFPPNYTMLLMILLLLMCQHPSCS